jgi:hypothetical protein
LNVTEHIPELAVPLPVQYIFVGFNVTTEDVSWDTLSRLHFAFEAPLFDRSKSQKDVDIVATNCPLLGQLMSLP